MLRMHDALYYQHPMQGVTLREIAGEEIAEARQERQERIRRRAVKIRRKRRY